MTESSHLIAVVSYDRQLRCIKPTRFEHVFRNYVVMPPPLGYGALSDDAHLTSV